MSENCPIYKQKLEDWKTSLRRVEALKNQFLETRNLKLKQKFKELQEEVEINKKAFFDFAYEEIEAEDEDLWSRIDFDVKKSTENLALDENTPWETIEVLSKIPDIMTDLTNIKQEYKNRIEHWEGTLKDFSQEVLYPKLKTTGKSLDAEKADIFSAPSLETVGWDLDARNATTFSADSLETVEWDLFASSVTTFSAPQLEEVERVILIKQNFSEFWDEEDNFDWDRAYKEGRLVIDEKIRDKVDWS